MGKRLLVLLLISVLVAPGFFVLVQPMPESVSPRFISSVLDENSTLNYTIYANHVTNGLLVALNSFTGKWNSHPSVYGNLIQLSVPKADSSYAGSYLSTLSKIYGLSFFAYNRSLNFSPQSTFISTSSQSPAPSDYLPSTIYKAYNYSLADSKNIYGNGSTIVIIDAYGDPSLRYDLAVFDNLSGLPPVYIKIDYLNKTPLQYNRSWALETAMDVEWAHASAPGARIILVVSQNAGNGLEDAVSYAVSNDLGNVISLSWGAAETSLVAQVGLSGIYTLADVYTQAYQKGITVLAASGDNGAYDSTASLAVNFPASDPYVTGVGGTSLFKYQSRFEENGWGGTTTSGTFGSGGGYSSVFSTQQWESAPGFTGGLRGVPDVSAIADKYTGVLVVYGGNAYQAGGTSLSTPIWGGVIARLDQYAGHPLGFANPLLYQIARTNLYNSSYNTILKGTNGFYNVTTGWNPVTGLGSPDVSGLMKAYSSLNSPYGFTVSALNAYNTTSISSTVTLNASSSDMRYNGTTFYFDSFYHNSTNYLRYGIAANSSGIFSLLTVANGLEKYSSSSTLSSYPFPSSTFNISIQWNGYSLTVSAGSYSRIYNLFIPFLGSALPGIGTEIIGSSTNTSSFLEGSFSNLEIRESGVLRSLNSYNETHFSGISGESTYSSISGLVSNDTVVVKRLNRQINGIQQGSFTPLPEITYMLSYLNPVKLTFSVVGNKTTSVTSWEFNGTHIAGDNATVVHSGYYKITALTAHGSISRTVFIQNTTISTLKLTNPISAFQSTVTVTVNHFSSLNSVFIGKVTLKYTSIQGENVLTVRSHGYYSYSASTLSQASLSYTMEPINPTLTLYVSPGVANVTAGITVMHGSRGVYKSQVNPGPLELKVSSQGYKNYTEQLYLNPGKNATKNIHLVPMNMAGLQKLSGFVRDGAFYYGLAGVMVKAGNSTISYTNSTGNFTLFLPTGNNTVDFSLPIYNNTSEQINLSANRSITVDLYAEGLNSVPFYSISIHYAFPLLFFFLYLSWSSQSSVSTYQVYYSTTPGFNTYKEVNVTGGQNYAILNVYPTRTYYVQVFGYSSLGKIVSSNEIVVSGTNLVNLFVNSLIVAGIAVYAAVAVRYTKKAFSRKRI